MLYWTVHVRTSTSNLIILLDLGEPIYTIMFACYDHILSQSCQLTSTWVLSYRIITFTFPNLINVDFLTLLEKWKKPSLTLLFNIQSLSIFQIDQIIKILPVYNHFENHRKSSFALYPRESNNIAPSIETLVISSS